MKRAFELLLGAAGPAVGAADAGLQSVAQGRLVTGEIAQLVVADRGRGAEERFRGDAAELGHDLVRERGVGDGFAAVILEIDGAALPGEGLLQGAGRLAAVLFFLLEIDGDPRPGLGARVPWPERLEVRRRAGHAPGDRELDGALDRGLAGLVRPTHHRHTGCQVDIELAVSSQIADLEPPDPHSDTSWPASNSRPRRRASRSSAASVWPA